MLKSFAPKFLNKVSEIKIFDIRKQCFQMHFDVPIEAHLNPWVLNGSYHAQNIFDSDFYSLHSICECVRISILSQWQSFCRRRFKKFIWHAMVKQGIISLLIFSFLVSSSLLILAEAQTDSGNNLSCLDSEISCDYNKCLTKILKCDGNADCMDGTDEKDCSSGKILRN